MGIFYDQSLMDFYKLLILIDENAGFKISFSCFIIENEH